MSKDQRRAQTKKALLDALVICLEDQDFNDITTIRLVQTAGSISSINMKERKREPFSKSLNFSLVKSSYQLYCLPMDQKKFKIF